MNRGRAAAGIDAFGAALGCIGLVVFAIATWKMLPHAPLAIVLTIAILAWALTAVLSWIALKSAAHLLEGGGHLENELRKKQ